MWVRLPPRAPCPRSLTERHQSVELAIIAASSLERFIFTPASGPGAENASLGGGEFDSPSGCTESLGTWHAHSPRKRTHPPRAVLGVRLSPTPPRSMLGRCRLTVGRLILDQKTGVQLPPASLTAVAPADGIRGWRYERRIRRFDSSRGYHGRFAKWQGAELQSP